MRCTYMLLLALLLFNCFFNEISVKAASNLQQRELNRDEIIDGTGRLRPKFIDLNDDVLFFTFDKFLDLIDLLSVASTNSRIAPIAGAVYRQKYSGHKVMIMERNSVREIWGLIKITLSVADKPTKSIVIKEPTLVPRFFQMFGSFIQVLSIDGMYTKDILESIRAPFEQLESLEITLKENASDVVPFNQLFPKLNKMEIYLPYDVNVSMIDCALPHLEYLKVRLWYDDQNQRNSIEGLIQKNPQIKGFEMKGPTSDNIKVINTLLPNLENITLHGFTTGEEIVQMDNVKHIVLHGVEGFTEYPVDVEYLFCPRLESVELKYAPNFSSKYSTFLNNHPHLKRLDMNYCPFDELVELTANLTHLEEFNAHAGDFEFIREIEGFLQSHPTLMKVHLFGPNEYQSVVRSLFDSLEDEWDCTDGLEEYDDGSGVYGHGFATYNKIYTYVVSLSRKN